MREKARAQMQKAKQRASLQRERRRAKFLDKTARDAPEPSMDASVLASLTKDELYEHAKQVGLKGRSKLNKAELIEAVRHDW